MSTDTQTNPEGPADSLMLFLGRIDGKLDSALSRLEKHEAAHDRLADRVTILEARWARIAGIAIGAGLGGAGLVKLISYALGA